MDPKYKFGALALTITAIMLFQATSVSACSCMRPGSPAQELNRSAAVFSGTVIDTTDSAENGIRSSSARPIYVTFEVSETWKGPDNERLVVTTAASSASCGYNFQEGKEYMVYATEGHEPDYGDIHVSLCSRTAALENAQTDITALGEGQTPSQPGQNYVPDIETRPPPWFAPIVMLSIILILIGIVAQRYRH